MYYKQEFTVALKDSVAVFMGYMVLGFSFGLIAVSSGFSPIVPIAMSIFIYAGALQFLAISLLKAKAGFLELFIAGISVNIRQIFYGLSLLKRFKKAKGIKSYLIFALTDETYALLTSKDIDSKFNQKWYLFYISLLHHIYWISGTALGAVFGAKIDFNSKGIEFALTALFVVLAIEQFKKSRDFMLIIIASVSATLALFISKDNMLVVAIAVSLVLLLLRKGLKSE